MMREAQASQYIFWIYLTWASPGCKITLFFRIYECLVWILSIKAHSFSDVTINRAWQYWSETDKGINVT